MIVFNTLAPHGSMAQNLVLVLMLGVMFTLGYAIRDTRAKRMDRARRRRERLAAEYNYRKAREATGNEHLRPSQAPEPKAPPTLYLSRVAPDCSARPA